MQNLPLRTIVPLFLLAVTGIFTIWLYNFHPSCYVYVKRYKPVTTVIADTIWAPAPFRISDIHSSDIQLGKHPRQAADLVDKIEKYISEKIGNDFSRPYAYVNQEITIKNLAKDTAAFVTCGWVLISALPDTPVKSPGKLCRIPPGQEYTFRFQIELPAGYHHQIIDFPNESNCQVAASKVQVPQHREITVWRSVKTKCNSCCVDCVDEEPPVSQRLTRLLEKE